MIRGSIKKIHFVGIGGTGMCGLAEILLNLGYEVCGSDLAAQTEVVDRLIRFGARVFEGHHARNISGVDLVVISSAIQGDNPEFIEASKLGIPILKRGQMLAEIMRLKYGVAVAGAHGKTTTTSLVGHVLSFTGMDPTVVVGGRLRSIGSNARMGRGDVFIAEADESDGSFLEILPTVAVVTNIDREHLDHYKNIEAIEAAFYRFISSVPFYGVAVVCGDDERIRKMLPHINRPTLLYGFAPDCRVRAEAVRHVDNYSYFQLIVEDQELGEFSVPLPGHHNVQNALASIAISLVLGVTPEQIRQALHSFEGVGRRFEIRNQTGGVTHVDDYGHHPTEIRAAIKAARAVYGNRRLVVFFQPHRYSRTSALHKEFADVFTDADLVVLTDIYAAGEAPITGVTGEVLRAPITRGSQVEVVYAARKSEAIGAVANRLKQDDVLITLGAGPIWMWGDEAIATWTAGVSDEATPVSPR